MASKPCSVCTKVTQRADGVCDDCWRNQERIRQSEWQLDLERSIRALEREWHMLDRIDHDLGIPPPRRRDAS